MKKKGNVANRVANATAASRIHHFFQRKKHHKGVFPLERATGIEPARSAWEAEVLPLNYARVHSFYHKNITKSIKKCRNKKYLMGFNTFNDKSADFFLKKHIFYLTNRTNSGKIYRKFADVAQSVEQLIRNQQVRGSSPLISSNRESNSSLFFI